MRHVLVETNWVVDVLAPSHRRAPAALELLERAARGDFTLHLPAFCLREARAAVQRKFKSRDDVRAVQRFLKWRRQHDRLTDVEAKEVVETVEAFAKSVDHELTTANLMSRATEIRATPGVEVFSLDDKMLARLIELGASGPHLQALDEAVLAAVLERSEMLREAGATDIVFCELDGHLLPWQKKGQHRGQRREPLAGYYERAGVRVVEGFVLP